MCSVPPSPASRTPSPAVRHPVALEILLRGPISRAELAQRLDLSLASLTRLTRPLLRSGLIVEAANHHEPRSGRPVRPLDVVPTAHHFVGVKLTGDDAHAVATTLRAEVVATRLTRLPAREPRSVVAALADLVAAVAEGVPRLTGLGVCLGGLTADQRLVRRAPFLEWTDPVPLASMLEQATGLPTVLANDVLALTRAEHWFGAARGSSHFAVVTIGAGVGLGLVVHDAIVESTDAGLGLVGHYPLDPLGPLCFAGHRGCASALLTMSSIEARVSVGLQRRVSYDQCLDLAAHGNPVAVVATAESGRALGRLVAAVANLTMARKIVLTGEGVRLAAVASDAVAEGIRLDRDPLADALDIGIQHTGFDEWARGAAATAIQAFVLENYAPDARSAGAYRGPSPASTAAGAVVKAARKRRSASSSSPDAHASSPMVPS
jgi:predicted NBD/HSP70 family sugar kinase